MPETIWSFADGIPVTPDMHLYLGAINLDALDDITIRYWIRTEEGQTVLNQQTIKATSGALTAGQYQLPRGVLLSAQIHADNVVHQIGRCFVYASVRVGQAGGNAPLSYKTLISDYVTPLASPTWPASPVTMNRAQDAPVSIAGTSPAAGAVYTYTVPEYTLLELLAIKCRFVADANAANRRVAVTIRDSGSNSLARYSSATNVTAGLTRFFFFNRDNGPEVTDNTANVIYSNTIGKLLLYAGMKIELSVTNIQAGDQLDQIFLYGLTKAVR